jgi:hypothetical protein
MSAKKRIPTILKNIEILRMIFQDNEMDFEYFEKLDCIEERILKLPELSKKKKPEILEIELDFLKENLQNLMNEVPPNILKLYRDFKNEIKKKRLFVIYNINIRQN